MVVVALFTIPVDPVTKTGTDWHSMASTNESYFFNDETFWPAQAHCVGTSSYLCTHIWVAFNWSTLSGKMMSFRFYSIDTTPATLLYASDNLSFGGYSMTCGAPPRYCADPFFVDTNDSSNQTWYFQWEVFYDYPTTQPVL
jgi:hypothetical protein